MDLLAVREALEEAIARARKEKQPTLLEAETYRYRGHSMSDPGKYRKKEEIEEMMEHDPILFFAKHLRKKHRVKDGDLDVIDKDVIAQVDDAVQYAEDSPWPSPETLYEDVYVRSPYIHAKAADRDPAWRASEAEDRVPEEFPAWSDAKVES
jgi:pyruvate dehydrogenase E1 component alpha subunit